MNKQRVLSIRMKTRFSTTKSKAVLAMQLLYNKLRKQICSCLDIKQAISHSIQPVRLRKQFLDQDRK